MTLLQIKGYSITTPAAQNSSVHEERRNTHLRRRMQRNVVVEWLTVLFRIREIPVSNLGQETATLTEVSCGFSAVIRQMSG
jgi:hypothetical protein